MASEEGILLRLAESIADGTPVDWERESQQHGELQQRLERLRLVESIGTAHRSWRDGESPTPRVAGDWGHLSILETIGRGGFGEVYRAYDPMLQKDVALKLLRSEHVGGDVSDTEILDEARRLARVRHPNVLTVHGAAKHDGRVGLWMDLIEGRTLEENLQQQGPLGAEEAVLIGIDLCRALAAVHAAGLVHHDVKTSNVMRETGGRIVLMDFSSVTERPRHGRPISSDPVGGTPMYMAPETFRGEDSGTLIDVYALGVVLYRLVTRRFPHEGVGLSELMERHRQHRSASLRDVRSDLPAPFVRVVERALEHDPRRRYPTVGEMERDLSACLGSTSDAVRVKPLPGWRRPAIAAAVVLGLALVAFLLFRVWPPAFEVEATLYRAGGGAEERLADGARIEPGDRLFMEIEGSRPMHVYVLNGDERGDAFMLFPLPGLDLENPLERNVLHRLPGAVEGVENYWDVTSVGGEEYVLVIASRQPLAELESQIVSIPPAGGPVELADPRIASQLRGIGGLSPEPAVPEGARSGVEGIAGRMSLRAAKRGGVWVWEMRLRNPD